ncbi:MAG: hypothetical protein RLZZ598_1736 [Pseudomonadota bacterium]|jgi:hypothetical protein
MNRDALPEADFEVSTGLGGHRSARGALPPASQRWLRCGEWLVYAACSTLIALVVWYLSTWVLLLADGRLSLFVSAVALRAIAAAAAVSTWGLAARRCFELHDAMLLHYGVVAHRPLRDRRGRQIALLLLLTVAGAGLLLSMHGA